MEEHRHSAETSNLSGNHPQYLNPYNNVASQQLQHSTPPHTLPPLQPHYASTSLSQSMYRPASSTPHTPRTPLVSSGATSAGHSGIYPQIAPQPSIRAHHPQSSYLQPRQSFQTPPSTIAPSMGGSSHPQSIAPAPSQPRLPVIRPMPTGGFGSTIPMFSAADNSQIPILPDPASIATAEPQPFYLEEIQPTHVVGSQGRRGILPSAPGRAPAVGLGPSGSTAKSAAIPAKDADGKFPCQHCTKTYLHAKHLKRHLLRHTGDRPYMCVLCKDTFSRSDILKRHFQKCSLRRGNPTGASHLSHSQAHLKKSHPGPHKPSSSTPENSDFVGSINGQSNYVDGSFNPTLSGIGSMNSTPNSTGLSRSNSTKRPGSGESRDQRSLTGPGPSGSARAHYSTLPNGNVSSAMSSGREQTIAAYGMPHPSHQSQYPHSYVYNPQGTNQIMAPEGATKASGPMGYSRATLPQLQYGNPRPNQGNDPEWHNLFTSESHDGFMNSMFSSNLGQGQMPVKSEPPLGDESFGPSTDPNQDSLFNGLYATPLTLGVDGVGNYSNWNLDIVTQLDPLQNKADRLLSFCCPHDIDPVNDRYVSDQLRTCLTVDNMKHFVELFTNFQGHWPVVHMPTFNLMDASDGLVLAIVSIGAVYSDRVDVAQVRLLMDRTKAAIQRSSQIYSLVMGLSTGMADGENDIIGGRSTDVDEIQALIMLQALFTWHGTQDQREEARNDFADICRLARRAKLMQPAGLDNPTAYSILHQPNTISDHADASEMNWHTWIEQERRSRVMLIFFLLDAALVIYFNIPPQFDPFEIRVPLPADDAAWDARSASECAEALGLHGPSAQERNVTGSRRAKQPEMHHAMKALTHPTYEFNPSATNVYSKFILIHGLHIQIWKVQRQLSNNSAVLSINDSSILGSGTSTPISQDDWVSVASGNASTSNSGRATPLDLSELQSSGSQHLLKMTANALFKWKKSWDEDMSLQYPPAASKYRRFGFCRDGVHFYWLARAFIKSNRASDWHLVPDSRFVQVMALLKRVKTWVASDNAQRGEEIGSVGDIDESYGVEELTLDMKLLFKPINQSIDSPVPGVQTGMRPGIL
ncbi:MAG: hypothetical protein M1827_003980 [Pycnora praestabilis]|nr:MAG: hypothetical protein M1827_003980 [Pycnora praestabilis]